MRNFSINRELIELYFENNNGLNILDIGCGNCSEIFNFFDKTKLSINKIICVDSGYDNHLVLRNEPNALYDGSVGYKRRNENMFSYIKEEELMFLENTNENYDLILFSNFLHFFDHEEKLKFLEQAKFKLNEGGIIYIKAANKYHDHWIKRNHPVFDNDFLSNLEYRFDLDHVEKLETFYEIIITDKQSRMIEDLEF
jgi:SAM-dependent methyltransferase